MKAKVLMNQWPLAQPSVAMGSLKLKRGIQKHKLPWKIAIIMKYQNLRNVK